MTDVANAFRLSPQQRHLWRLGLANERGYLVLELRTAVDPVALEQALLRVVDRFEILRTRFRTLPGREYPVQVIDGGAESTSRRPMERLLDVVDCARSELAAAVEEALRRAAVDPFSPEGELLLRAVLLVPDRESGVLVLILPVLLADRGTLRRLAEEVVREYGALVSGRRREGLEDPFQYADFAGWQNELLSGEEAEPADGLWIDLQPARIAGLKLPMARPFAEQRTFRPEILPLDLAGDALEGLRRLADRCDGELADVLAAAWYALLWRFTGESRLVLGRLFDGRNYEELEATLGPCARTVPVSCRLAPEVTFSELLLEMTEVIRTAEQEQEHFSWEPRIETGEIAPQRAFLPLQIECDEKPTDFSAGDLSASIKTLYGCDDRFHLKLLVAPGGEEPALSLHYDAALLDRADVSEICDSLAAVIAGILADPAARLRELDLLSAAARDRLLVQWNATEHEYPRQERLHELFAARARRCPERPALVFGGEEVGYGELDRRADRLARCLRRRGVGPEVLVALCAERSVEMVVAVLGIWKAGGAFVPLDPELPERRLAELLAESRAPIVLTRERWLARLPELGGRSICLDRIEAMPEESTGGKAERADSGHLAYVVHTSGTSGRPKGILGHHRGAVSYLSFVAKRDGLATRDRVLQLASLGFDAALRDLIGPLLSGATVVLVAAEEARDPRALLKLIRRHRITILPSVVPSLLRALLEVAGQGGSWSLRRILLSGERLRLEDCHRVWQIFGQQVAVINQYGPSECTMTASRHRVLASEGARGEARIGRPIANTRFYVLDASLRPLPVGVPGELSIAGVGVTRGYFEQPRLTAEKFVPDAFGSHPGRLYRTGDLVRYLPGGELVFVGRRDDQVKIRGYRVEPAEIEAVLREQPSVSEVAVVAHGDPRDLQLVAYVVARGAESRSPLPELRNALAQRLPSYMLPAAIVPLDALPVRPNGKVNRGELARRPPPAPQSGELRPAYAAPRTASEEMVAEIWATVLDVGQVGRDDDFFELGGHSLLATQVMARLQRVFQVDVSLQTLFERPRLSTLAQVLDTAMSEGSLPPAPPIEPTVRDRGDLPLSFAQRRLWFLDQLEPGSSAYIIALPLILEGELDAAALRTSLEEVVRRHEVTRTTFHDAGGTPVQRVHPPSAFHLPLVDLRALPPAVREDEARRRAAADAVRPFDLGRGRLLRATLIRLDAETHAILLSLHHIICDLWSTEIVLREVASLYSARRLGRASPLPELAVQYADFCVWQQRWFQGEVREAHLTYWKSRLADAPAQIELPTDRPRPPLQRYRGAIRGRSPDPSLARAVQACAGARGATTFMVLMAAFQALLGRLTGRSDIVVGTPIAGRTRLETEALIGLFVNTLVIRTDLSGEPDFRQLLARVREVTLGAYTHQEMPFEQLVDALQPERSLGRNPLFQVMIVLQNISSRPAPVDLELRPLLSDAGDAKFDLELFAREVPEGLVFTLQYDRDLFDAVTVDRLLGSYHTLLNGVLEAPEDPLPTWPVLRPHEIHQVVVEWNAEAAIPPDVDTVDRLFERQAACAPDAVAVIGGKRHVSYGELDGRTARLARRLVDRGLEPDAVVAVLAERGIDFLAAMLGVWKAGGAYLPLDPHQPAPRHARILRRSGASPVLVSRDFSPLMTKLAADLPSLGPSEVLAVEDLQDLGVDGLAGRSRPPFLAYVIYTSGSTGVPKGVMVEHRGMLNHLRAKIVDLGLGAGDQVAQTASQCFDISVWQFVAALLVGGRVRVFADSVAHDPERLAEVLERERISIFETVPSLLRVLLDELGRHSVAVARLAALRWLIPTGEALPPELCRRWSRAYPRVPVLNAYGPTECSDDVSHALIRRAPSAAAVRVPIGRPVRGLRLHVLDRSLRSVPVGAAGELCVAGIGVGRGYLREGVRTAEVFIPDPLAARPGERLYRTGDLTRHRHDGTLDFLGRIDHQVKVRGFRIELGEIEAALTRHPGLAEAVVMAREHLPGGVRLVAYAVASQPARPAERELRRYLSRELPEYMVPRAFVFLEAMPLTPSGKVDRRRLPAPEPESGRPERDERRVRTPVEEGIVEIWREVLALDELPADADFFDLGGHSLLATQVVSRLREIFQVEVPLRSLFETPTVTGLAGAVEKRLRAAIGPQAPPLEPLPRNGPLPLSFAQERLWFLYQLEPESPVYNVPAALRLRGPLRIPALRRAFSDIGRRHEVLRTTFELVAEQPVQTILPPGTMDLPLVDLSALDEERRQAEIHGLARAEAARPFDLLGGIPVRVTLLRAAAQDHAVLFTMHHIASDEWSVGILIRELRALYLAHAEGRPSPLAPLPVQYADFAVWQRRWLTAEALDAHLAHWRDQLEGAPSRLELAADPQAPAAGARCGRLAFPLSSSLSARLAELCRREGLTLFMALVTCFQTVLHWLTGQDDLVVGTDVANRNRLETEGLIGFFINQLALRSRVEGDPSLRELLRRNREVTLGAYAHQDLPFEKVVEALQPERELGEFPFFRVKINLVNVPMPELELRDLMVSSIDTGDGLPKLDLIVDFQESRDGLLARWQFDRLRIGDATVETMMRSFEAVTAAATTRCDVRLSEIRESLDELEREWRTSRRKSFRTTRRKLSAVKPRSIKVEL